MKLVQFQVKRLHCDAAIEVGCRRYTYHIPLKCNAAFTKRLPKSADRNSSAAIDVRVNP